MQGKEEEIAEVREGFENMSMKLRDAQEREQALKLKCEHLKTENHELNVEI